MDSHDSKNPAPEFVDKAGELMAQVLELPVEERASRLEELCSTHPECAELLRAAMAAAEQEGLAAEVPFVRQEQTTPQIPGLELIERLGAGGMGVVWLAEQHEPVRRKVAVKLIRAGMSSSRILQRFESERQALARMSHPCVAQVFGAGTTRAGMPYFVMEYVEGTPIHRYCSEGVPIPQRLELFLKVCDGVHHAHQKGIIHRDLKPSNILVVEHEGGVLPKIIDFGVAKATEERLTDESQLTEHGAMLGTPEYMSPEQAANDIAEIDTRSDVYSLGVILYELLTGSLPFESKDLRAKPLADIVRTLRESQPPRPSSRLETLHASTAVTRRVRGDLDWITMRAMEKEREHRYASASELAADVRRYLRHEPVLAGPPSRWYRARRFARRHRVPLTALTLIVLSLAIGLVMAWRQTGLARRAAARFDRLSVMVQLDDANAELTALQPPWPDKIGLLKTWLRKRGDGLEKELPAVRKALRELEARVLPQTEAEKQADRERHPKMPAFLTQQKKVQSLRQAMAVRNNEAKVADASVPAGVLDDPRVLSEWAWARVTLQGPRLWGQEPLALAHARRAVALAKERRSDKLHWFLDTLAWAQFANGLDDKAKVASAAALAAAPVGEKKEYQYYLSRLGQFIDNAVEDLADAESELSRLGREVGKRQTFSFADEADKFLYQTLRRAEHELVAFLGEEGARLDVQRRLEWAERIQMLTENHPNARVTWTQARDAIRRADGKTASELYGPKYHADHPIELKAQMGLVPIGMNPKTKLWEFYHLRSAWDPRSGTDPTMIQIPTHRKDGSIDVTDGTGVVFVLLPGRTFMAGAQATDPNGPNYDELARPNETRLYAETVRPFFLARHELTQGQWIRLSLQDNPSERPAGFSIQPRPVTLSHPVEGVDWETSTNVLAKHGLLLPTELQWEYGCRAGTTTPWFCGKRATDLEGYGNIMDATARQLFPYWNGEYAMFTDGHAVHAPVGTYLPNGFGLYDVHGNLAEWTSTVYDLATGTRVTRGGTFGHEARYSRSSNREDTPPTFRGPVVGFRSARALH